MSDVLGHILVRETHGIRRFLYPLWVSIPTAPYRGDFSGVDLSRLCLTTDAGEAVPCEVRKVFPGSVSLDFALSLDPSSQQSLRLSEGTAAHTDDPIMSTITGDTLTTRQRRLAATLGAEGAVRQVVYDGVPHLRAPCAVTLNGRRLSVNSHQFSSPQRTLTASVVADGLYGDSQKGRLAAELSACKSWVHVEHTHEGPQAGDRVTFLLPFQAEASTLLCDFGAGGGIYGKLQRGGADEAVWHTRFRRDEAPDPHTRRKCAEPAEWSLALGGRTDYQGTVAASGGYVNQLWFHLVDQGKALAVAIPFVAVTCVEMTVSLRANGDVAITFLLGETPWRDTPATFGVRYHFLNDVPAVAAATNPQSILLPPTVVELPA